MNRFSQDLALNSEMFHVAAAVSEDDSDAAPLLPEASPRTQRKFDTVRQDKDNNSSRMRNGRRLMNNIYGFVRELLLFFPCRYCTVLYEGKYSVFGSAPRRRYFFLMVFTFRIEGLKQ